MIHAHPARGIYEDEIAPAGERWFKVVTSTGRVGVIRLPTEMVDPGFMDGIKRRLDALDPERSLKVV